MIIGLSDTRPVIFLAFANDRDDTVGYLRNLPDEARRLREVLEAAERAGLCEVVVRTNSTAGDLFKVFQDPRYRNRVAILHYGGHANGYQLLLESAAGQSATADAGGLAAFLGQQRGLQLVFLNGCSTQPQTQGLLDANVPAVISTSRAIDDRVATDFSCQFYQGLAGGASVASAFQEAVAGIKTTRGGETRALYFGDREQAATVDADRWPWAMQCRRGAEAAGDWNLPEAADDPLFGLPPFPPQDLPESPFRHLHRFRREHAEVFFGRGREIRNLYHRVTGSDAAPIILFCGQSGVGKSSLLDAGLLPRLESGYDVRYLQRVEEEGLAGTLYLALLPEIAERPAGEAWLAREQESQRPLVVILDQAEEAFTHRLHPIADEFPELLRMLTSIFGAPSNRPRGRLVLGFRKEWLAEIEQRLIEAQLPRTRVFLERLDLRGVKEAIAGPVRSPRLQQQFQLTIESGLADAIANDLSQDADTPLAPTLQVLLTKLWEAARQRDPQRPCLDQTLYRELKSQGVLLGDFVDQQLTAIESGSANPTVREAARLGLLLDVLALHTTVLGTSNQVMRQELERIYCQRLDVLPDLLAECVDRYLLTVVESRDRTDCTRLSHDTLGPIIRQRFEQSDRDGQRAHRILEARVDEWQSGNRVPLHDADWKVVERGKDGSKAWTETERELIDASRRAHRRRRRLRYTIVGGGIVMLLAILTSAAVAVYFGHQAELQRQEADAQRKQTEESLAASWLAPLPVLDIREQQAFRQPAVGAGELQAFWDLAQTDKERLRLLFLQAAFHSEYTAKQLISRRDTAVLASVGLNAERRQQVLRGTVKPRLDDPQTAWPTVACCVAIGQALAGARETFQIPAAKAIVRKMQETEDPVELAWLGDALVQVKQAAEPGDAMIAFQRLGTAINRVQEDSYPALLGESFAGIADVLPAEAPIQLMNEVLGMWETKHDLALRRDLEAAVCRIAARVGDEQVAATVRILTKAISRSSRIYPSGFGGALAQAASRLGPAAAAELFPVLSNLLAQASGPPIYIDLSLGWTATVRRLSPASRRQFLGEFLQQNQDRNPPRARRLGSIGSVADALSGPEAAELLMLFGAPPPPGSDPTGAYAMCAVALGKRCEPAAAATALQAIFASAPSVQQLDYESAFPAELTESVRVLLARLPAAEAGPLVDQMVAAIAACSNHDVRLALLAALGSIGDDELRHSAAKRAWEISRDALQQSSEADRWSSFAGAVRQLAPQLDTEQRQTAAQTALSEYEQMHNSEFPELYVTTPLLECFADLDGLVDQPTRGRMAATMMKTFRSSLAPAPFPRDSLRRGLVKALAPSDAFAEEHLNEVVDILKRRLVDVLGEGRSESDVADAIADLAPRLSAAQQDEFHKLLWPAIQAERNHSGLATRLELWCKTAPPTTRNELAGKAAARLIDALRNPPSAQLAGLGGVMSQQHVLGEIAAVLSRLAGQLELPDVLRGSEAVMGAMGLPDYRESQPNMIACLRTLAERMDKVDSAKTLKWPVCTGPARTVILERLAAGTDLDLQGNVWNVVRHAPSLGIAPAVLDAPAEMPGRL